MDAGQGLGQAVLVVVDVEADGTSEGLPQSRCLLTEIISSDDNNLPLITSIVPV